METKKTGATKVAHGGPSCDYCDAPAVRNYQKAWVVYEIDEDGDYDKGTIDYDLSDPVGEDNVHCCDDHDEEAREALY